MVDRDGDTGAARLADLLGRLADRAAERRVASCDAAPCHVDHRARRAEREGDAFASTSAAAGDNGDHGVVLHVEFQMY